LAQRAKESAIQKSQKFWVKPDGAQYLRAKGFRKHDVLAQISSFHYQEITRHLPNVQVETGGAQKLRATQIQHTGCLLLT
jgi:hypothetical protein